MTDDGPANDIARGTTGVPWKFVGLVVLLLGLVIFFFQNEQETKIQFLWLDGSWPVWAVIGISVAIGILLDRLGSWQWRRSRARRNEAR